MPRFTGYLLNLLYLAALVVLSPAVLWAMIRKGKYREGHGAKLFGLVPKREGDRPCVWFHAVSVGEVNVLRKLVADVRQRWPDVDVAVSSTTMAGFSLAKKRFAEHSVFYCPLDFSWAVRTAMRRIRPRLLVLAELELWPNLIGAAKGAGAGVAVVNGRISDKSFRGYRRIRPFVASMLRMIDVIAAQDKTTAEKFRILGARPETVHTTGSLKYDGAETNRENERTETLRQLANISVDDIVFLAGSTQSPEESIVLDTFRTVADEHPRLRLVLVPRHPERFNEVARLLDESGLAWQRRSALTDREYDVCVISPSNRGPTDRVVQSSPSPRILLVDSVGELGAWWGVATIGFVGGSLGSRGGQNMIEPAAYSVATSFGPNTRNFRDIAAALLAAEAAVVVETGEALTQFVRRCATAPPWANQLGQNAQSLVASQLGATERTVELLTPVIEAADGQPISSNNAT